MTLLLVAVGVMFLAHSVVLKLLTYGLPGTVALFEGVALPGWLAYVTCACEAVGVRARTVAFTGSAARAVVGPEYADRLRALLVRHEAFLLQVG